MVTRILPLADRILTIAREVDRRLATATVEQARQAVEANERRRALTDERESESNEFSPIAI